MHTDIRPDIPRSKSEHKIIASPLWSDSNRVVWEWKKSMRQNRETRTRIAIKCLRLQIKVQRFPFFFTVLHMSIARCTMLKVTNWRFYERITQSYFFPYIIFLLASYNTTSNLYVLIELIDFYPLRVLQKREYKTHDNIYGKNVLYIAFSDDWIAYWRNGQHHRMTWSTMSFDKFSQWESKRSEQPKQQLNRIVSGCWQQPPISRKKKQNDIKWWKTEPKLVTTTIHSIDQTIKQTLTIL